MLESFENQFISGEIPKSLEYKFTDIRTHHDFVYFYDKEFIIAHMNNLYRFNKNKFHLTIKNKEFVPVEWGIEVLNPLTKEFISVSTERSDFNTRNSKREVEQYTKDHQQYLKVDYNHHSYWLWFDITTYVQDKYSKEVTISHDDYDWLYLDLYDTQRKIKTIKDYRDNVNISWLEQKVTGHSVGFIEAQDFYSFIQELNEELSTLKFGNKYSELYDAVLKGEVTKEDFLKEIVK